jgi:AP2 domain-containing protein
MAKLHRTTKTHGDTAGGRFSREYSAWAHAIQRCTNPNDRGFKNYGGRGIRICERWLNSYEAFLEDMGRCPEGHMLDRIDNGGNYEPGNCRWTTRTMQNRNRRNSQYIAYQGQTKHVVEWAAEFGMTRHALYKRLWSNPNRSFSEVVESIKRGRNQSGYVGVYQDKRDGAWYAQRMVNNRRVSSRRFNTPEEAADAYEEMGMH